MTTEPSNAHDDPPSAAAVQNTLDGSVSRHLVQAGSIAGSVRMGDQNILLPREPTAVRRALRADIRGFFDRQNELKYLSAQIYSQIDSRQQTVLVSIISGMGGVGKTAFAFHAAWHLASIFPDVHLEVDLKGFDPAGSPPADPAVVLADILTLLGVSPEVIPASLEARSSLFRDRVSELQALIVLDNAADESQVRPLIPGGPHCLVLITSRNNMAGLEGAIHVSLNEFSDTEALELFTQIVGRDRVEAEPYYAAQICQLCGGLAIAISVAAARIRSRQAWSLADYAGRLQVEYRRLSELQAGDRAVAAVFSLSYQPLPDLHRQVFRWFAFHPGEDGTAQSVAALANLTPEHADEILENLLDFHLLQQILPGRYRMHDLIRSYARQSTATEDTPDVGYQVRERALGWYLHTACTASRIISPGRRLPQIDEATNPQHPMHFSDHKQALGWFEDERHNLVAAVSTANTEGLHAIAWQLPQALFSFYDLRRYEDDWIATCNIGLNSARQLDDSHAEARLLDLLGGAYIGGRRFDEAITCYQQSISLRQGIGDRRGEAIALSDLGIAYDDLERFDEAIDCYRRALPIRREVGDRFGEGNTLNNLGESYRSSHRFIEAIECYRQALPIRQEVGDRFGEGATLNNLGKTYLTLGDIGQAFSLLRHALVIRRSIDDRWGTARTLIHFGSTLRATGDLSGAQEAWSEALAVFEELNDPRVHVVRSYLNEIRK